MSQTKLDPRRAVRKPAGPPEPPNAAGRRQMLLAALLLVIGGVWIGVPLRALLTGARPPLRDLGIVGMGLLLAAGIGQALWGLNLLARRKTLIIDRNAVHVSVRGLLGVRRWSEPLANYRGLRHRRERIRHRYGLRTLHRLQLAHPDPAKEIELIRTQNERQIAAARRQWAKWLDLPIWSAEGATAGRPAQDHEKRPVEAEGVPTF